jgi:Flp pilus assembly protein TadD
VVEGNADVDLRERRPATNRYRRLAAVAVVALALGLSLWFWQGRSHLATPKTPEEIEQQAANNPNDFNAQLRWGETLVQEKRLEEATPVLTHARDLAPSDARPYAWLGVVAATEHRSDEARALLHEALQRDPSNTTAIRAQANLDAQAHRLRPAIQGFERLTQLRPDDADAWQRLGLLLIGAGENYRSLDALTRAATLDPTDLVTQHALGNMALQAGRLDQADRAYHVVLAREPDDPQARVGLALVMMRRDPSPAGLKMAEQQVEDVLHDSPSPSAYGARAQVRMTMRRFDEAIEDFNTALSLDPNNRDLYVLLSQCYASAGKPDLARKASAEFERRREKQLARDLAAGRPSGVTK